MKSKSQFSFVLIIITALLLGSCSPARSLNVTVTSQVTVTSIKATPEAPSTPTPKPTDAPPPAAPTREATPTPDPRFHELTQDEIDNLETIKYIKISSAEKQQYADYISKDLKIGPGVIGAKLSQSFTNAGAHEIQLNLKANKNIVPRFALEIDGVKMFMYEAKIKDASGNITHGPIILCEAGTVPNVAGDWRVYDDIIKNFQQDPPKDFIIRLILEVASSEIPAGNPNATILTNVVGQEEAWDPSRAALKDMDAFTPDMSITIWWAKNM